MTKIHIEKSGNASPHYLYDLSLPLPTRRMQRILFPSAMAAAAFLGVKPQRIYTCRGSKGKIWSEAQHSWFVVRLA